MLRVKDKANTEAMRPGVSLVNDSWGLGFWGAGVHSRDGSSSQNHLPQHPHHCCIPGVAPF